MWETSGIFLLLGSRLALRSGDVEVVTTALLAGLEPPVTFREARLAASRARDPAGIVLHFAECHPLLRGGRRRGARGLAGGDQSGDGRDGQHSGEELLHG